MKDEVEEFLRVNIAFELGFFVLIVDFFVDVVGGLIVGCLAVLNKVLKLGFLLIKDYFEILGLGLCALFGHDLLPSR